MFPSVVLESISGDMDVYSGLLNIEVLFSSELDAVDLKPAFFPTRAELTFCITSNFLLTRVRIYHTSTG